MRDVIITMTHYTAYFGSFVLLWFFMVLQGLGVDGFIRALLLIALATLLLLFSVLGIVYVVGLGGGRHGSERGQDQG